ncbi:RNA pseudouridylate synthase family protein [Cellvibrio japonicus Ueda107]|uniref:Pseudouridine synthase n=1 Tax=Cellvibrio japonicus (strain Ueda107) TaxID=498211 RepID=B3PFT5_CELJU|nr:RNA pseudouridylate synthase family protein [Cellvibrio japonicus Ueda107]
MIKKYTPDSSDTPTRAVKPVASKKRADVSAKPAKSSRPEKLTNSTSTRPASGKADSKSAKPAKTPLKSLPKEAKIAKPSVKESASPVDEKLQKVLARAGIGSRREMERAIEEGRVKVNDRIATLGDRVTLTDKIFVGGQRVVLRTEAARRRVILYNKPEGEICSRHDPEGRPTVYDSLPSLKGERWISVGRLDFNTSGLLLFTNDGELANKLMHPSSVIDREYLVRIQGDVDDDMKERLLEGVLLDDGVARFTDIVDGAGEGKNRWFYCVVMEGRNREVRRLWESQGVKVSRLKRVRYANIFIPSHVRVGQWTELTEQEIRDLCMTAGFDSNNYTRIMRPSREEVAQIERHEKKLRSASSAPKRVKVDLRKRSPRK